MSRKFIWFIMLLALTGSARGQTPYSYRYWFDGDETTVSTGTSNGETAMEIDISSLPKGKIHALHMQAIDARNKWGAIHSTYFYYASGNKNVTARYWFDNTSSTQTTSSVGGMMEFDVAALGCGVHVLHFQVIDASGNDSPAQTIYFYKGAEGKTARYWFDNEKSVQTTSTINGLIELDIEHLTPGVHALHFQTFSASGEPMPVHTQYFKKKEVLELSSVLCKIWIDDDAENAQTFGLMEEIVIDAPDLSYGMHELHVILLRADGQQLAEKTTEFEVFDPDGISLVPSFTLDDDAMYNLAGQRIQKIQKGIYIKGGKKILR